MEIAIAAVAGGAFAVAAMASRRLFRKVLPEGVWEALPDPIRDSHEHEPHVAGTVLRGGKKHKKMYCVRCQKRWTEPC